MRNYAFKRKQAIYAAFITFRAYKTQIIRLQIVSNILYIYEIDTLKDANDSNSSENDNNSTATS